MNRNSATEILRMGSEKLAENEISVEFLSLWF